MANLFLSSRTIGVRSEEEGCWITNRFPLVRGIVQPFSIFIRMPIFRAIGLGLVIIIFQLFIPRVFRSFEDTLVGVFNTVEVAMSLSQNIFKHAGPYPLLPGGR